MEAEYKGKNRKIKKGKHEIQVISGKSTDSLYAERVYVMDAKPTLVLTYKDDESFHADWGMEP